MRLLWVLFDKNLSHVGIINYETVIEKLVKTILLIYFDDKKKKILIYFQ